MKIFLVTTNDYIDYDNYDSVVVFASTKKRAISIAKERCRNFNDNLDVLEIGQANAGQEQGVVLASFNAG